jgi:hypothetical protein
MQNQSTDTGRTGTPAPEGAEAGGHKPPTLAENILLTIKILVIAAILIGALWVFEYFQQ